MNRKTEKKYNRRRRDMRMNKSTGEQSNRQIMYKTQAGVMCVMQVEKKAVFIVSKEKGDTSFLERNAFAININLKRKQIVIAEG